MAGHVQDRWYKTVDGPDGTPVRLPSERHGSGLRYRARYVAPDGRERNHSFPDKQKRRAEAWLAQVAADMTRGQYVDPGAGKMLFERYVTDWLSSQTSDVSTRAAMEIRLRVHVFPRSAGAPSEHSCRPTSASGPTGCRRPAWPPRTGGCSSPTSRRCSPQLSTTASSARTRAGLDR